MRDILLKHLDKLVNTFTTIRESEALLSSVERITERCISALRHNKKILFAGNGGSAADSQHLAAELVSRLQYNRPGLASVALTTDTSALTAIGNDYGFEHVFSRQLESIAQPGDVLIAISTSGKSPNIIRALQAARVKQLVTVGFTGANPNMMFDYCDEILSIPSKETPTIQECHIAFGHIICEAIEETIYGAEYNPLRKQAAAVMA